MHFENCPFHHNLTQNLIVNFQSNTQLLCSQCFNTLPNYQHQTAVILNQNTINYFFRWNQYLIDQLNSIKNIVSQQGLVFLFENISQNKQQQAINQTQKRQLGAADPKQILLFVISQHIELLHKNLAYMSQPGKFQEQLSSLFMKDLFIIMVDNLQVIVSPIKNECTQILKQQYSYGYQLKWQNQILKCIQSIRKQILNDWARDCLVERQSLKQDVKNINESTSRLETQNSLNRSNVSCESISFENDQIEQINLIQSDGFEYSDVEENILNENNNENYQFNQLKEQNEYLRQVISQKEEIISQLKLKMMQSQQQCQQWMFNYRVLENEYENIRNERIPSIQNEIHYLNEQMEHIIKQNEDNLKMINELQETINILKQQNMRVNIMNMRNNQKKQNSYYMNPYYEKNKIDEQLLQEVVELQSINMQKDNDIKVMISCIQMTRKMLLKQSLKKEQNNNFPNKQINNLANKQDNSLNNKQLNKQNININNEYDKLIRQWQRVILPRLNRLQTINMKQL